jgi:hypothetical protein
MFGFIDDFPSNKSEITGNTLSFPEEQRSIHANTFNTPETQEATSYGENIFFALPTNGKEISSKLFP